MPQAGRRVPSGPLPISPSIVYVLPEPVMPYAKIDELKPAMQCSTMADPAASYTSSWVDDSANISSTVTLYGSDRPESERESEFPRMWRTP